MIETVRGLHAPTDEAWPTCQGCDWDGYEAEPPAWPCRTAEIVYTADEVAAVLAAAKVRQEVERAEAQARREARDHRIAEGTETFEDRMSAHIERAMSGAARRMVESSQIRKLAHQVPVTEEAVVDYIRPPALTADLSVNPPTYVHLGGDPT